MVCDGFVFEAIKGEHHFSQKHGKSRIANKFINKKGVTKFRVSASMEISPPLDPPLYLTFAQCLVVCEGFVFEAIPGEYITSHRNMGKAE